MKKDTTSKDILKSIIKDISKYILHFEITQIELLDTEFERIESRRADIVAKIDNEYILHLEIQNNNDYQMPYRMLRYLLDINLIAPKYNIKQYIIYIGKEKLCMRNYVKNINLDYNYTIIDMKTIDCEYFLRQDKPDALVLAILCDFKGKNPHEIVGYIIEKLQEYTKNDIKAFRKYMLMLEELSTNRDLKNIVKEQEMLSTLRYEDLPSYEIGMEKGIQTEKLAIIKNCLQQDLELAVIAAITELTVEEVQKVISEI
ncbi:hypothetical protein QUF74_02755 [Candidatus Halobeggiatoa sp. HSG11]|nr:hypothetical protein [Candidatus Halobeggiatoa sp. HSG11]